MNLDSNTEYVLTMFTEFLQKNSADEKFVKNFRLQYPEGKTASVLFGVDSRRILMSPFSWAGTEEGSTYWSELHSLWEKRIDPFLHSCNFPDSGASQYLPMGDLKTIADFVENKGKYIKDEVAL